MLCLQEAPQSQAEAYAAAVRKACERRQFLWRLANLGRFVRLVTLMACTAAAVGRMDMAAFVICMAISCVSFMAPFYLLFNIGLGMSLSKLGI